MITPGQILYRVKKGWGAQDDIVECVVDKVGRKYFYLTGWDDRFPINKETMVYLDKQYSQNNFRVYLTKQEILDEREKHELYSLLQKHFSWGGNFRNNTIEELRSVCVTLRLK